MKSINGIIDSVKFGFEDHGLLVLNLYLKLEDGAMCCFGGICLGHGTPNQNIKGKIDGDYCAWYIAKVLEIVGVEDIEVLKGKPLRAIFANDGRGGDICIGIQHFLHSNIFFIPKYVSDPNSLNFDGLFPTYDDKDMRLITNYSDFRWIQDMSKACFSEIVDADGNLKF